MRPVPSWRAALLILPFILAPHVAGAAEPFELRDGDRVVFLGDTFFEREGDNGAIEAQLTAAWPDRHVIFRNLAWAADTPSGRARASFDWNKTPADWLKRVKDQLALVKPSVAFLSYGMTEALESGSDGVESFIDGMNRLMDALDAVTGRKVPCVLLGPIQPWGEPPGSNRTRDLQAASTALRALADARGARFIDTLALSRALGDENPTAYDSPVALSPEGYAIVASRIVKALGGEPASSGPEFDVLATAIRHKNEEFFHRWRPANWTYLFGFRKQEQGQNAVEIPRFEPLVEQWDERIAHLRDLRHQDPATVSEVRGYAEAHSKAPDVPSTAPQEIPTFELHPGFEVSLWAEDPLLFKPIQINWDPKGRLWIASSRVYPMIRPGQEPEDAVIVLEDADGDGKAEKSTVFADGLLIPTSMVPDGTGGCYVGASHQLLHFEDTDGDGHADRRTIVLSSFGTEDTHHNLHTLRWGYDGHLYMNQSIYTHSHIETPWGVCRLNSGGIWRFNPDTWHLEVFTRGGCNPWGHHWDQFGNHFFTDGAGFKGVYHAMEGATYFTYADMRREAESITPGSYPKFCSLESVHSPAFPADWQGRLITCDFRAHRVVEFGLQEAGANFQAVEMPDLLRSTNVTFRPIDLRFGPDGALYIADWSNPIIQHGEVDFRDPRRDKEHGRIWRVTASAATASSPAGRASPRDLTGLSTTDLLDLTLSANAWDQEQARLVLRQRGSRKVLPETAEWLRRQTDPRARLEVAWLYAAFEQPALDLLRDLAGSPDPRLRVAAARQLQ